MIKKVLFALLLAQSLTVGAQEKKSWISNVKLSGYGMVQYQYNGNESTAADEHGTNKSNSFNLRLARFTLDGRILEDFYWKAQVQFNGNTSTLGSSPRVVDLFAEWQKLDFFKIKVGQFKRPFTFENPMHPIDQGFMSYSQNISALAGFSDRAGAHASNGRDIGIQLQGDFLKNKNGRDLLHYQVGVFNGQGINVSDVDQQKDLIGGMWFMPIKGMRIGAFGWTGSYARKGTWTEDGETKSGTRSLQQRRYAISAEYKADDWTLRSEYIHSTGYAFATRYQNASDAKDCTLSGNGDKADGVYALVIAPVIKNKVHAKARYDMYRSNAEWNKAKTFYEIGADYMFHKNFQINVEYALVNDRSLAKHNYSMFDVEVDWRF
ncbi:MAG: porin [Prevotella sp.]|nr:porin [Prevotella sp.]MBQ6187582.1 porin [Prevotella sp.]